jgi:hypothetical protein
MTDQPPHRHLRPIIIPDNTPIFVMAPLSDHAIAVIRHDDQQTTHQQKLADPTRLLWDRHCLLAEVDRLRALINDPQSEPQPEETPA